MRFFIYALTIALSCSSCEARTASPRSSKSALSEHWSQDLELAKPLLSLSLLVELASLHEATSADIGRLADFGLRTGELKPIIEERYPIRAELRRLARNRENLSAEAYAFFSKHTHYSTEYAREVLTHMGPSPDFVPKESLRFSGPDPDLDRAAQDLSQLLKKSWALLSPHSESLFALWRGAQVPPSYVEGLEAKTLGYLKYQGAPFDFGVLVYPTLNEANGMGVVLNGDRRLLLVGPTPGEVAQGVLIVHEFMHHPVERASSQSVQVRQALRRSECAFEQVQVNAGYSTWPDYFYETFIRAASPEVLSAENPFHAFDFYEPIVEVLRRKMGDAPLEQTLVLVANKIGERCRDE